MRSDATSCVTLARGLGYALCALGVLVLLLALGLALLGGSQVSGHDDNDPARQPEGVSQPSGALAPWLDRFLKV
ncbi:MAG: hypothetical protein L0Z62_34400 [Gemmataceae bacterium]|nr:hypothetical protein [Gemmataceae bacterium]